MKILCQDRERIFLDGSAEEWTALELHANTCATCAEEVRSWKAISAAACELRDYQDSSALWTRIERALEAQKSRLSPRKSLWGLLALWRSGSLVWQTALVGALVVVLAVSGAFLLREKSSGPLENGQLLKSRALADVERTERDYMKAIDKLAVDAKPQLESPTPVMSSYREKIMVLDGAIDELRAETGQNPSNAHLRYQLLAMYQEKQETLQEILETKR